MARASDWRLPALTVLVGLAAALVAGCDRFGGPFERGQRLLQRGDAQSAVRAFTDAIEQGVQVPKAYAWRCYANLAAGENEAAVKDCSEALARLGEAEEGAAEGDEPYARWQLLNNRGVAYLNMERREEAEADFQTAIELNPGYAEAYANRGRLYVDEEDWEKALADLTRAIELNPDLAEAYGNRGRAYEGLGDGEKALADYDRAIELSHDTQAYFNRAMLRYATGDFDAADRDFREVIDRDPPDSYLRFLAEQYAETLSRRATRVPEPTPERRSTRAPEPTPGG